MAHLNTSVQLQCAIIIVTLYACGLHAAVMEPKLAKLVRGWYAMWRGASAGRLPIAEPERKVSSEREQARARTSDLVIKYTSDDRPAGMMEGPGAPGGAVDKEAHAILEVFPSEAGFTSSTKKKPIVATYGCGSCVAVGGYDGVNHAAFVMHFQTDDQVDVYGDTILEHVARLREKPSPSPIKIYIRGGQWGLSDEIVMAIKDLMMKRADIPMKLEAEERSVSSLRIDSRSGAVGEYDPQSNPHGREWDTMSLEAGAWISQMTMLHPEK